ncbi:cytochrome P450 [Segniliparus rotundus DSM 44985]|uniref:Cytochrome P450 n=1 Tax=Segniliparus rotundus (strain ATCC BAA-972 / CDC 1076 / CIP 108378 / DSM 44985 / JCM 13578) TaxID=640132 RepID=D6Z841_SEGRD|nr:cytochrome P450 [Segniliparus rotundus]ADG98121.1 cytochrome P450 [Segniliparus rotundus DSM 44985]
MEAKIWIRWACLHGSTRAAMRVIGWRGEPLARLVLGRGEGEERYRLLGRLRDQGVLVRKPFVWASGDHGVCRAVLRDNRFAAADAEVVTIPPLLSALFRKTDPQVPNPVEPPAMVAMNPPEHTHYRRLVAQSFTPRAIDKLNDRVVELVTELLDNFEDGQSVDLVRSFAAQLPVTVIAEMLGMSAESREGMLDWGDAGAPLVGLGVTWPQYRRGIAGLREADRDFRAHFDRIRRGACRDDTPFTRLAADGQLSYREFAANAALLVGAGFETTVNLIAHGIVLLLQHPDQLALLRDDPSAWPGAVEEILRFESPVQMTARVAREEVDIAGRRLRPGHVVVLLLGGANRDPSVFPDPDRFDVTRRNAREHLAFGSGVHACVGGALARAEGAVALRMLFERFPGLRLIAPPEPTKMNNLHGYKRLRADLGAAAMEPSR